MELQTIYLVLAISPYTCFHDQYLKASILNQVESRSWTQLTFSVVRNGFRTFKLVITRRASWYVPSHSVSVRPKISNQKQSLTYNVSLTSDLSCETFDRASHLVDFAVVDRGLCYCLIMVCTWSLTWKQQHLGCVCTRQYTRRLDSASDVPGNLALGYPAIVGAITKIRMGRPLGSNADGMSWYVLVISIMLTV